MCARLCAARGWSEGRSTRQRRPRGALRATKYERVLCFFFAKQTVHTFVGHGSQRQRPYRRPLLPHVTERGWTNSVPAKRGTALTTQTSPRPPPSCIVRQISGQGLPTLAAIADACTRVRPRKSHVLPTARAPTRGIGRATPQRASHRQGRPQRGELGGDRGERPAAAGRQVIPRPDPPGAYSAVPAHAPPPPLTRPTMRPTRKQESRVAGRGAGCSVTPTAPATPATPATPMGGGWRAAMRSRSVALEGVGGGGGADTTPPPPPPSPPLSLSRPPLESDQLSK